tara:strand:- start:282 stop:524 length:243 start_codon:yes stop_codon:yes gene_type:complete
MSDNSKVKALFNPVSISPNSKIAKFEFDFSLPDYELQKQYQIYREAIKNELTGKKELNLGSNLGTLIEEEESYTTSNNAS